MEFIAGAADTAKTIATQTLHKVVATVKEMPTTVKTIATVDNPLYIPSDLGEHIGDYER